MSIKKLFIFESSDKNQDQNFQKLKDSGYGEGSKIVQTKNLEAIGPDFKRLIAFSKKLAEKVINDPEDYGYEQSDLADLKKYGLLPSNPGSFNVVFPSDDGWEVHSFIASGNGGSAGVHFVMQNGKWTEEESGESE